MKKFLQKNIKVAALLLLGSIGTVNAQTWVAQIGSVNATHAGTDSRGYYGRHIAVSKTTAAVYTAASYQGAATAYSATNPNTNKIDLSSSGSTYKFYLTKQDANGNFLWTREVTTSGSNSYATSVALDGDENVYVTGAYGGPVTYRISSSATSSLANTSAVSDFAIFLIKYDKDGNRLWTKTLNPSTSTTIKDEAFGLDVDADNNVLLAGSFSGTNVAFDWGAGEIPKLSSNTTTATDGFVMKMAGADGQVMWAKRLGGADADLVYAIKTDASKNVYVTGSFLGTADFVDNTHQLTATAGGADGYVLKLNGVDGEVAWVKQFKSDAACVGWDIAVDNNATTGGVVVVGESAKKTDFGNGQEDAASSTAVSPDLFAVKLKPNGDYAWSLYKGYPGWNERATGVAIDATTGNIFVTGLLGGDVTFAPGYTATIVPNTTTPGTPDLFVLKLATDGTVSGVKSWGNTGTERGTGIALDASENVYITGIFGSQPVTFGDAGTLTFKGGSWDTFVFKMNPNTVLPVNLIGFRGKATTNGNLIAWSTLSETDNSHFELERSGNGTDFSVIKNIMGKGNSSVKTDYAYTDANAPAGTNYYRLKQVDRDGKYAYSNVIGIDNALFSTAFTVYPNPVADFVTINNAKAFKSAAVKVVDITGKSVYAKSNISGSQFTVDLTTLKAGLYFVQISNDNEVNVVKILKK